jgi:hypothetical protein
MQGEHSTNRHGQKHISREETISQTLARKRKEIAEDGTDNSTEPKAFAQHTEDWACPFFKLNPEKWSACRRNKLSAVPYVKQHLLRRHLIDKQTCHLCLQPVRHHGTGPCKSSDVHGVKLEQLQRTLNSKDTKEEQWYSIWTRIFPGVPRPQSPYTSNDDVHEYHSWHTSRISQVCKRALELSGVALSEDDKNKVLSAFKNVFEESWREWNTLRRSSTAESQEEGASNGFVAMSHLPEHHSASRAAVPLSSTYLSPPTSTLTSPATAPYCPSPYSILPSDLIINRTSLKSPPLSSWTKPADPNPAWPKPGLNKWNAVSSSGEPGPVKTPVEFEHTAFQGHTEPRTRILDRAEVEEWMDAGRLEAFAIPCVPWESMVLHGRHTRYSINRQHLLSLGLVKSLRADQANSLRALSTPRSHDIALATAPRRGQQDLSCFHGGPVILPDTCAAPLPVSLGTQDLAYCGLLGAELGSTPLTNIRQPQELMPLNHADADAVFESLLQITPST